MTQHYDVAVVGMQFSGLVASALLAKQGRRVLLVDNGEDTLTYRHQGYALPLLPALLPSLEGSPPFDQVHRELGMAADLRGRAKIQEPLFQAVLPRHRIDIHSRRSALIDELRYEFPQLTDAVENFFNRLFDLDAEITELLKDPPPLPPDGIVERLRSRSRLSSLAHLDAPFEELQLLSGVPADHPVRDILLTPLSFFGYLWGEHPSTLHAVRLMARYYRGVVSLGDGIEGLPAIMLQAAEKAGVEIHRAALVRNVEVSGRRLTALELDGERHRYSADFFITNTVGPFHELLPPEQRHPKLVVEEQAVGASGSMLVINMLVKADVIPYGMGETVFLLNGRRCPRTDEGVDPPLLLRRYQARRYDKTTASISDARTSQRDEDHEVLSVACPVRTADLAHSPGRLASLKAQISGRVRRVIPFLDDFLVSTSLPTDTTTWDLDAEGERRIDPWRLHPIYEPAAKPLLGVAARPTRTFFKNAAHCGRDVLPGLGLEGEYLAGLKAANALKKLAGKRWHGP